MREVNERQNNAKAITGIDSNGAKGCKRHAETREYCNTYADAYKRRNDHFARTKTIVKETHSYGTNNKESKNIRQENITDVKYVVDHMHILENMEYAVYVLEN